jgi:hypothetical protein
VIIVDASGFRRRPAIPDTSDDVPSVDCWVRPGKDGPRGWIILVGVEVELDPEAEAAGTVEEAGAVIVVVVVEEEEEED